MTVPTSTWLDIALGVGMMLLAAAVVRLKRRLDALAPRLASLRRMDLLAPLALDLAGRVERLEALSQARPAEAPPEPAPASPRLRIDAAHEAVYKGPSCPTLIEVPSLAAPLPAQPPSELAAELDRRFGPIWGLADAGLPLDEIVRRTGHPIGEVELILGLRRRRPLTMPSPIPTPTPPREAAAHG